MHINSWTIFKKKENMLLDNISINQNQFLTARAFQMLSQQEHTISIVRAWVRVNGDFLGRWLHFVHNIWLEWDISLRWKIRLPAELNGKFTEIMIWYASSINLSKPMWLNPWLISMNGWLVSEPLYRLNILVCRRNTRTHTHTDAHTADRQTMMEERQRPI